MPNTNPRLVVVAGPNGAGKSTISRSVVRDQLGIRDFVNADAIAIGLSAFDPERAAMAAGRVMLRRLDELAQARVDFAFETTLASVSFAPWIASLRREGYRFHMVFVSLPTAEAAIERVKQRVAAGGHSIPDDVVRRRYARGLSNFFERYRPLADEWRFFDNSVLPEPRLISRGGAHMDTEVFDEGDWKRFERPPDVVRERREASDPDPKDPIQLAASRGVREALLRHKRLGQYVVEWRDGRAVHVQPEQIELPPEDS